jgi:cholesterol transport system auxiliary component
MKVATSTVSTMALLLLAGCGGLKSNLPIAQVYVLRPTWPAPTSVATAPAGSVQVTLPLAAAGLATESIVVLRSGERLDYYRGARWAGAAPGMLQTLAIDALRGTNRFVMVESDAGPFASEYVLSLELRHFEAEYAGPGPPTAHVELICTFGKRASRDVIVSFTAQSRVAAEADRLQAVVAAFERATADALTQMAANVSVPAIAKP